MLVGVIVYVRVCVLMYSSACFNREFACSELHRRMRIRKEKKTHTFFARTTHATADQSVGRVLDSNPCGVFVCAVGRLNLVRRSMPGT